MNSKPEKINIVLSGGGTGGSVTPLIAIAETLNEKYLERFNFTWVGTESGVERAMTRNYPFVYHAIAAGKLRRYFSFENVIDVINVIIGFFQSLALLSKIKPQLVMSAGGFVSVPLVWAAKLSNIPVIIHQQDIRPGLANKLMSPCATIITVTFEKNVQDYGTKAVWTGNPIRGAFAKITVNKPEQKSRPSILILGGGTGSEAINNLVRETINSIIQFADIVHITGKHDIKPELSKEQSGYQCYDLLDTIHVAEVMKQADLVVTRAGLGTLSELSFLGKATIIIPIPHSHQEDNANYFGEQEAAIVLQQENVSNEKFVLTISELIRNPEQRKKLGENMNRLMKHDANEKIAEIIETLI